MPSYVVDLREDDSLEWSVIVVVALLLVEVVLLEMGFNDGMTEVGFV